VADDHHADPRLLSDLLGAVPMSENLNGMTSEQLMLRDLIYEIHEILEEADKESRDYQRGVAEVAQRLEEKMSAFEIDQSRFARQMPNVDAWYHGRMQ
jgi:hypothetical protein